MIKNTESTLFETLNTFNFLCKGRTTIRSRMKTELFLHLLQRILTSTTLINLFHTNSFLWETNLVIFTSPTTNHCFETKQMTFGAWNQITTTREFILPFKIPTDSLILVYAIIKAIPQLTAEVLYALELTFVDHKYCGI